MNNKFKFSIAVSTLLALVFMLYSIVFATTYQLSGRVTDQSGNPLENSIVEVLDPATSTVVINDTTDVNGNYSMIVEEGIYDVKVTPPSGSGFGSAIAFDQNISTDKELDFVLVPAGSVILSGTIYNSLNEAMDGQRVILKPFGGGTELYNTTDSNGVYAFEVAPGEYDLVAESSHNPLSRNLPDSLRLDFDTSISLTQTTTLDIYYPLKRVDVHVQDPVGNPVTNVELTTNEYAWQYQLYTSSLIGRGYTHYDGYPDYITDAQGNVSLWLYPTNSNKYTFSAHPPAGTGTVTTNVTNISVTDDRPITITLQSPITITGTIYNSLNEAMDGQRVILKPFGGGTELYNTTDSNGVYAFEVAPGEYDLVAESSHNPLSRNLPDSLRLDFDTSISLTQTTTLDIYYPLKRVDVHVQDPVGNPVTNVELTTNEYAWQYQLYTSSLIGRGYTHYDGYPDYITDAQGNVSLWLYPTNSNKYTFSAHPPAGTGTVTTNVTNISVTDDRPITITLQSPITITGTIYNSLNEAMDGQRVILKPFGGGTELYNTTDSNGVYAFEVAPGEYDLVAESSHNPLSRNLPDSLRLDFDTSISLTQTTTLDIYYPLKRVDVHVQDPVGNPVTNVELTTNEYAWQYQLYTSSLIGRGYTHYDGYPDYITDAQGNVSLWLYPTNSNKYTFSAHPPAGLPFVNFNLTDQTVGNDKSIVIVLQFVHAPPFTAAAFDPTSTTTGTYPGPVTVSFSASATSGYVIDATYYKVDDGPEQLYTAPFIVSGDGSHTIRYWSVDDFSVYETPKTRTIEIASLEIVTELPLPGGITGEPYAVTLEATGGRPPYTWAVTNGSLPQGLVLDSATGVISGTMMVSGNYNFTAAVTDNDGTIVEKALTLTVESPFTDLSLSSADITFTPTIPDPGTPVAIGAVIRNPGWVDLSDVVVNFYDFGTLIGQETIGSLNAGTSAPVSFETTFADTGFRLITVKVDPDDVIIELNENNNEASQVLQVGSPDFSTAIMVVQASIVSICQGKATSISGRADYDFSEVPGTQDHPVQGGNVTVTILDPATSNTLSVFTGAKTSISGNFSQPILAPVTDGTYPAIVSVSDNTVSTDYETSIIVSGVCPTPPPPPPPSPGTNPPPTSGPPNSSPGATADVYIYSEHILYSDENPDPGETMTVFAYINFVGTDPVLNMPVVLNDIYPVAGVLRSFPINSTLVSFPDGQNSSPVAISIPWTNTAAGAHIIQAVTEPPFSQFTGNDKATRLIFVGDQPLLQINKNASLLVDADDDGAISPGDTILYTISFENQDSSEVTGVVITDDYDETLLQTLTQISDGGTATDGVITWNLGALAAGASGSVTYEAAITPESEFPSGTTVIVNFALLSTDQTPAVAATHEIEIILNQPPEVSADEPFTVDEGDSILLTATGIDPDGDTLTYAWDLDGNGTFETLGQNVPFTSDDGPDSYTVSVQVTDPGGLTASEQTTVSVLNVAPTASLSSSGDVDEGSAVVLTFSSPFDPSDADTAAGFLHSFDCTDDGIFEIIDITADNFACSYDDDGVYTAKGRIKDKDGGFTDYTVTITVLNIAPTATFTNTTGIINEGESITLSFIGPFDPSEDDTVADFLYSYDCTNDGVFELNDAPAASFSCSYPDNGIFTVLGRITDKDGGFTDYTVEVLVNNLAPVVGPITAPIDPVSVDLEISASADFTDAGVLDTHTAVWDWGDGTTSSGIVTETDGSGSVTGDHIYTEAGVYTIILTVTDKDGDFGISIYEYVVVYDPSSGFVTGGGWIDSPTGAYPEDPTLVGRANFGFVAKYKKGALVPTGETEFHFQEANLNFHSESYDWLVISEGWAQFKGSGTINGEGDYIFFITMIDGSTSPDRNEDLFRIKIWNLDDGSVVYDSQLGDSNLADPVISIGGGSLVIHKSRDK